MDHNLDTLNLDSAMGVDFESADHEEVSQTDLALSSSSHEGIPMEFEQIEEQPMLMETDGEEIIDFMGDGCGEFTLQEYSVQDDQTTGLTTIAESNQNVLTSQAETMLDLQIQPQTLLPLDAPKIISVKAAIPTRVSTAQKIATAAPPRQVAIAPKPPRLATKIFGAPFGTKQFAIAPKPVALVKKVSIGNVVQSNTKGNTVLAQIGKQLVVMPTGPQKLKLVTPPSSTVQYVRPNADQASLIPTKDQQPRPVMMTKVIVQGQQNMELNQQAVLTKLLPTSTAPSPQARFVALPQKTVPIAIGNKVVMASPTKQGVKLGKKQQIIAIQPSAKLLPAPGSTAKKVVLAANPAQNVILKTTAPPKTGQIGKDGNVLIEGQHTQLHQINVPGKGIQYIRLVTQNATQGSKVQPAGTLVSMPSKFVLTDNKAGGKKLVRIAPVMPKTSLTQPARSSQSLLAPLSPAADQPTVDINDLPSVKQEPDPSDGGRGRGETEQADSKTALRSLIEHTVAEDNNDMQLSMSEVEIDYKRPLSPVVGERQSVDQMTEAGAEEPQHSLIVIRSGYDLGNDVIVPDNPAAVRMDRDEEKPQRSLLNLEADMMNSDGSPPTPQPASEPEMTTTELGLRPRKACNCTKSQCLKLYCDCFANGEFCNRCNCNNCHNNLENEELRQKAIRGCLDRNPNAFRPKIGKAKSGGPEIVRRHNKGCNCKRSGCLKNYCECYEAKIACTAICKCVGCRNVEESLERFRRQELPARPALRPCAPHEYRTSSPAQIKQPCSFMTSEVIEAVCQCLVAAAGEPERSADRDPMRDVIDEFARCLQDIIGAAHHATPTATKPHDICLMLMKKKVMDLDDYI